jgi:hypothetical protein
MGDPILVQGQNRTRHCLTNRLAPTRSLDHYRHWWNHRQIQLPDDTLLPNR